MREPLGAELLLTSVLQALIMMSAQGGYSILKQVNSSERWKEAGESAAKGFQCFKNMAYNKNRN